MERQRLCKYYHMASLNRHSIDLLCDNFPFISGVYIYAEGRIICSGERGGQSVQQYVLILSNVRVHVTQYCRVNFIPRVV